MNKGGFKKSTVKTEMRMYEGYPPSEIIKKVMDKHKDKKVNKKKLKSYIRKHLQLPKDLKKSIKKLLTPSSTINSIIKQLEKKYNKDDLRLYKFVIRYYIKKYKKKNPKKFLKKSPKKQIKSKEFKKLLKEPALRVYIEETEEMPVSKLAKVVIKKTKKTAEELENVPVAKLKEISLKKSKKAVSPSGHPEIQKLAKAWIKEKILSHTEMIAKLAKSLNEKTISNKLINIFYEDFLRCKVEPNFEFTNVFEEMGIIKDTNGLIKKIVNIESGTKVSIKDESVKYLTATLVSIVNDFIKKIKNITKKSEFETIENEANKNLKLKCSLPIKTADAKKLRLELCIASSIVSLSARFNISYENALDFLIPSTDKKYGLLYEEIKDNYGLYNNLFGDDDEEIKKLTKISGTNIADLFSNTIDKNTKGKFKNKNIESDDLVFIIIASVMLARNMKNNDKLYNRLVLAML